MRQRFPGWTWRIALALICVTAASAADPVLLVDLDPVQATVGDPLTLRVRLELPDDTRFDSSPLGPELGPFTVSSGSWSSAEKDDENGVVVHEWTGKIAAFETGSHELPPVVLRIERDGEESEIASDAVAVEILSVLSEEENSGEPAPLADLKPPASLRPNLGPAGIALAIVLVLLVLSVVLHWLHRRYAAKFSAAEVPDDPFRRTPPHEWVYAELQQLLAKRLPEQGLVDPFYEELARILKTYLGGRYRVDLLERTTIEIAEPLRQAGAETGPIDRAVNLLEDCDLVKFARERPDSSAWRQAVERVYGIVDSTRPVNAPATRPERGAA